MPRTRLAVFLGPRARGNLYDTDMTHEIKGWFFLAASMLLLLVICGLAMIGLLTRPVRWAER